MKLATLKIAEKQMAARKESDGWVTIPDANDVGELLKLADWAERANSATPGVNGSTKVDAASAVYDVVIPRPSKILCCGLNYATHIQEMGREQPTYPTLFAKFPETLAAPYESIVLPDEDPAIDWEAELVVVVGKGGRRIPHENAAEHIAGYTVANDVSMRTWQFRTIEWLQGKMWDRTTPLGPVFVTPDEISENARIQTLIDDEIMQDAPINDLVHGPEFLISYISTFTHLNPGDLILTGTTGGVGRAREPERYLADGEILETRVEGIGSLLNKLVKE